MLLSDMRGATTQGERKKGEKEDPGHKGAHAPFSPWGLHTLTVPLVRVAASGCERISLGTGVQQHTKGLNKVRIGCEVGCRESGL